MRILIVLLPLGLGACAMSVAGLGDKDPRQVLTGTASAETAANCAALSLQSDVNVMKVADGHYVLSRNSMYGVPYVRWDFRDTPTGVTAELRATSPVGEGVEKVRTCIGG